MLFDSHCHLNFSLFDDDREAVIKKIRDLNMKVIDVGTDLKDSEEALNLTKKYPDVIWASVGIHPNDRADSEIDWEKFEKLAGDPKVIGIGECGLDYYHSSDDKNFQKELFIKQIEIAKKLNKPLIIHCRPSAGMQDAYEDAVTIIQNSKFKIQNSGNGVSHFFSGSKETAKKFLDLGFYISFAGPITFSDEYREIVESVPLDKILIETDAPFAAPVPHRGQRNEPAFVEFVARRIAEWKNIDFEAVAEQTSKNAQNLFKINSD